MKKGFVLFLSIIFVAFTGFMPVKADNDITIGGSSYIDDYITNDQYKRINYSGLLMEYLRQGGTVDISNMDTNSNDLASNIINEFGDFAVDVLRETGNFIDWIGNDQVFQEELIVNRDPIAWKPALKQNVWQLLGQLPFMSLNQEEPSTPTPTPPTEYTSYIDTINSINPACFFWGNTNLSFPNSTSYDNSTLNGNSQSYSYCSSSYGIVTGSYSTSTMYICPITDVYIYQQDGQYYFNTRFTATCYGVLDPNKWGSSIYCYTGHINNSTISPDGRNNAPDSIAIYKNLSYSGTLVQCLSYLTNYCRNINIYVNGVPWSIVGTTQSYNIQLSTGTVVPTTNGRVEWKYDDEIYIDIDLIWQLLDRFINDPNRTTNIIDFGVLKDCIVDANGQTAIAVKVIQDDPLSIDDQLVLDYGTLIPIFPVAVDYPIDVRDTARIAVIGVQVLPSDIIEIVILGIFGMLFVCFVHRGLE